ncbi:P-loop NTPase fold protein [Streptomyces sp. NPDC001406]|uniref:P-loop NTPase fold protein n=1 Tax=Streptomyces sp. NPDC001406 TaxID=3364572 RepID=UPI0036BED827
MDRLERKGFALRLARTLAERTGDRGYVVGLYGRWGEGKSTVLNFVRHGLASYPAEQVTGVEFNPWFDSDETHLYAEFLHAVAAAAGADLERKYEKAIRRASRAQRFAESVGLTNSVNNIVKVSTLLGAVGGLGQPTLRDFHDRLREVLAPASAAARRVVVLMDDIDRLDDAQISAVFRMVKLAADFPNLCFLLAFDQDVVAEALGARYRAGGAGGGWEFLEKIINAPLQLPRADPSVVAQVLREMLDQVLATHRVLLNEPGERIRLDNALEAAVWPCVTSLRQGKRLLSKADFALPIMAGEVNPADQVLMEALQLLFPDLYSFAATHKPPIPEVAEDLGIHPGTLHSWVSRARRNGSPSSDRLVAEPSPGVRLRESERAELERLRAEAREKDKRIRELEMERDVCKRFVVCG